MVRLILSSLLLILALLTVIKAPTNIFWKLSIGVIEWGQYFAIITIVLLLCCLNNKLLTVVNVLSVILFSSTVIRAYLKQNTYETEIRNAFPADEKNLRAHALSFPDLFKGINYTTINPVEYISDEINGLKIDFYGAARKNAPCVIAVHGGAWNSGDRKMLAPLNSYLAGKGYSVAAISYRFAPDHRFGAQAEDIRAAIHWIKTHAEKLNIDSTKLVLLGRSAGAQLAQQVAYVHPDSTIRGVISFYCPADLVWGYSIPGNPLIMDSRKVLDEFIGESAFKRQDLYEMASPAYHINSKVPPTLLLHGKSDVMVAWEHSRRVNEKLEKAGVKHYFVDLPWATHGFDFAFNGPSSQISLFAIEHFLANVCPL